MALPNQVAPSGRLASFVRTVVLGSARAGDRYVRLPDGEVELIARISADDVLVHALGARTTAVTKPVEADFARGVAIRFKAGGAYPFFGVPLSELTDRGVSIETLWGSDGKRLRDELADARSTAAALQRVQAALAGRLERAPLFEPATAAMVRRAVRLIRAALEPARIEDIARELGVSTRTLRRAFHDVVGVGPKPFARIVRFQRALRAARGNGSRDWGAIAVDAGYYDQSHLIADFRALAGATPGALVSEL